MMANNLLLCFMKLVSSLNILTITIFNQVCCYDISTESNRGFQSRKKSYRLTGLLSAKMDSTSSFKAWHSRKKQGTQNSKSWMESSFTKLIRMTFERFLSLNLFLSPQSPVHKKLKWLELTSSKVRSITRSHVSVSTLTAILITIHRSQLLTTKNLLSPKNWSKVMMKTRRSHLLLWKKLNLFSLLELTDLNRM